MASIIQVEGIGEAYAERLKAAGIRTTDALLESGATPGGRKEIEEKTGIAHSLILEWVNHVDLWRIKVSLKSTRPSGGSRGGLVSGACPAARGQPLCKGGGNQPGETACSPAAHAVAGRELDRTGQSTAQNRHTLGSEWSGTPPGVPDHST